MGIRKSLTFPSGYTTYTCVSRRLHHCLSHRTWHALFWPLQIKGDLRYAGQSEVGGVSIFSGSSCKVSLDKPCHSAAIFEITLEPWAKNSSPSTNDLYIHYMGKSTGTPPSLEEKKALPNCGNKDGNMINVLKSFISTSVSTVFEVCEITVPMCTIHCCLVMSFWLKVWI